MSISYRIANWDAAFECAASRKLKRLEWVAIPNKTDSEGYTALVDHPNAAAHLGAWYAIVECASKQKVRGTLPGGIPQTIGGICQSLSRTSRLPASIFAEVIPRLLSIGWLVVAESANVVAESANVVAESANVVAESANVVAESANVVADDGGGVALQGITEQGITEQGTTTSSTPSFSEINQKLRERSKTAAPPKAPQQDRAAMEESIRLHEWTREVLMEFPGARNLDGKPDDAIIRRCLDLVGNQPEVLSGALRRMHHAGKAPTKSWAWFPSVIPQYSGVM